ncbi:MAG TPA: hypothetical protein VEV45_08715 [Streptosporangiaceae bacterium]|nr:hypothetical protein [Streptosporangiaceae bacterium]
MTAGRRPCRLPLTCPRARRRALADSCALAQPDGARPQHAAQLARSRRVYAVTGAQREVFVIAGHLACRARGTGRRGPTHSAAGDSAFAGAGDREPVVGVWPGIGLRGVAASRADLLGELGQFVAAPLPDGGEWLRVPREAQRDLIRLARAIMAAHRLDRQHRAIDAT